jgi:hypothetical protein
VAHDSRGWSQKPSGSQYARAPSTAAAVTTTATASSTAAFFTT